MANYNVKKIENTNTMVTTLSTVCKKQCVISDISYSFGLLTFTVSTKGFKRYPTWLRRIREVLGNFLEEHTLQMILDTLYRAEMDSFNCCSAVVRDGHSYFDGCFCKYVSDFYYSSLERAVTCVFSIRLKGDAVLSDVLLSSGLLSFLLSSDTTEDTTNTNNDTNETAETDNNEESDTNDTKGTESDTNDTTSDTNDTESDTTENTDNINIFDSICNKQLIRTYVDGINNGLKNDNYKQTRECFEKVVQILPDGYEICFTTETNIDMTKVDVPIYNHRYRIIRDKTVLMFTIHKYSEVQHKYIPLKPETKISDIIRYIYFRTFDSVCLVFKHDPTLAAIKNSYNRLSQSVQRE